MYKALQTMIDNMPEKTGKSLDQWKKILKGKSFEKHGEAMTFLKGEHGVTHGFSNTIIHLSKEDEVSSDDLVTNQYKGKEDLLPIFEKLRAMIWEGHYNYSEERQCKFYSQKTICPY
jgi:hypothetical protein